MPLNLTVCIEFLQIHYNDILASHFSKKKTLDLLLCKYYWSSINADILDYILAYNLY